MDAPAGFFPVPKGRAERLLLARGSSQANADAACFLAFAVIRHPISLVERRAIFRPTCRHSGQRLPHAAFGPLAALYLHWTFEKQREVDTQTSVKAALFIVLHLDAEERERRFLCVSSLDRLEFLSGLLSCFQEYSFQGQGALVCDGYHLFL